MAKHLLVSVEFTDMTPKAGRNAGKTMRDALVIRPDGDVKASKKMLPDYMVEKLHKGHKVVAYHRAPESSAYQQALRALELSDPRSSKAATPGSEVNSMQDDDKAAQAKANRQEGAKRARAAKAAKQQEQNTVLTLDAEDSASDSQIAWAKSLLNQERAKARENNDFSTVELLLDIIHG